MASLVRECGSVIWSRRPLHALRMRVRRSAIGSVIIVESSLPARLDEPGNQALQGKVAHADAAELEAPVHAARTSALLAAGVSANGELGLPFGLDDHRFLGHVLLLRPYCCCCLPAVCSRNGIPSCVSSARPCASSRAVVTIVTDIP